MINPMNLTEKKIIVTGASSGLGRETAIVLSKLGAEVILVARNEEKLKETMSKLEGRGHIYKSCDLRDVENLSILIDEIVREKGKLDGIAYCAGIADMCPLKNTTYKFLHNMMLIDFYAFIEMSRLFSLKKNNNGGSIVAISSIASKSGDKTKTAYCAAKSAVDGAIRAMSTELARKGIRINSVVPGFIQTDMYGQYLESAGEGTIEKNVLNRQFLGLGEPVDVANAIAYLLSDAAKFITGTGMVVDGGFLV